MAVASVALDRARAMMNDRLAAIWTDAILMPFLDISFQEAQAWLRKSKSPFMKVTSPAQVVLAGTVVVGAALTDLVEPIRVWAGPSSLATSSLLEEVSFIPQVSATTTLKCWSWTGGAINLLGATTDQNVYVHYWKNFATPASGAGSLVIPAIENYIAPKIASLAMASVGQDSLSAVMAAMGLERMEEVVSANRGAAR